VDDLSIKRTSNFLKKIQQLNLFIITIKANDYRMSSFLQIFETYEKMFGKDYWDSAVICVTFWNWKVRLDRPGTETTWCEQVNQNIEAKFQLKNTTNIPCFFIDSYYFQSEPDDKSYFDQQSSRLVQKASQMRSYSLSEVTSPLSFHSEMKAHHRKLKEQLKLASIEEMALEKIRDQLTDSNKKVKNLRTLEMNQIVVLVIILGFFIVVFSVSMPEICSRRSKVLNEERESEFPESKFSESQLKKLEQYEA